jgi:hypothetical protein
MVHTRRHWDARKERAAFLSIRTAIGDGDATRVTRIAAVSSSYFDFFDAQPVIGRFFEAEAMFPLKRRGSTQSL